MGQTADAREPGSVAGSGRRAVAALCAVQFVDVLSGTIVIAALPSMLAGLDAPASAASLVVTGYAVFFGALLLVGARLGDRHGHGRVLRVGLVLFAVASIVAAAAPTVVVLVLGRAAQGVAAAASVPAALRLLAAATPREDARRRALAAWSATGAAAGATGLVLGGALTDVTGWRSLFWINVPLAALLLLALRRTPSPPARRAGPLDLAGGALLTGAVASLVLGASFLEVPERRALGALLLVLGASSVTLLVRVERRAADPLLPPAAARHPGLRTGAGASFANTATTSSAVTLATLHLQEARGLGPTAAGFALLPFSLAVICGAAVAARVLRGAPPRVVAGLGLAVIAVGDAALLASPAGSWVLPLAVGVAGFGIGLSSVAATTLGTAVPAALQGTAAGALNTAAQLGTALGVAAVLLVATAAEGAPSPLSGPSSGWLAAALVAAAAAAALVRPRPADVARGGPARAARRAP